MEIVRWMTDRFEIFSILGILSWSTCSKQKKCHLFCCKMLYRDIWGYCVGVHVVTGESATYSVAKYYTEILIGYCPTFDLVHEHFSGEL